MAIFVRASIALLRHDEKKARGAETLTKVVDTLT
jgi:hypothetical protein